MSEKLKILVSGGGTGGHIFPAIAIADAIKEKHPSAEIEFVGANGRMEMEKVPLAGYNITGLNISGLQRKLTAKNLSFPAKVISSICKSSCIIKNFKPDLVIGTGGYASGPLIFVASRKKIPSLIHEQNAFPGITNKILAKRVNTICVSYPKMEKFFPKEKIVITGNPIRKSILELKPTKDESLEYFGLKKDKNTLLIIGGSQGAAKINEAVAKNLQQLLELDLQILWQSGKYSLEMAQAAAINHEGVIVKDFIQQMDKAYVASDYIISRAGAIAIAEIIAARKPAVYIPLPSAAEDHQTKNAMSLVDGEAGLILKETDANKHLAGIIRKLVTDNELQKKICSNLTKFSYDDAAKKIANEALKLVKKEMKHKGLKIFFLGIGGIGMSALARWYNANGAMVYGYDLVPSKLTDKLSSEGIEIHYNDDPNLIPDAINFVVFTPAIPNTNHEYQYFRESGIPIYKRAEIIGNISKDFFTVAIGGTHGKTSITALTAHILKNAGMNITAFIGGISNNYKSNLILSKQTDVLVVEADEFDRSLLKIHPDIAVITSADSDHLDIYKDNLDIINTFIEFSHKLPSNGKLIHNSNLSFFTFPEKKYSYGTTKANICANNIRIENGFFIFDFLSEERTIKDIRINVPGIHNIENTLAAIFVAISLGLDNKEITKGIESFKGVERRMEVKILNKNLVFIDDYAHHPKEIRKTIEAVRMMYPNKKLTIVFQPHLYSRTRDFADDFARELSKAETVYLMDIYPARELPIPGITSQSILKKMEGVEVAVLEKKEIKMRILSDKPELIVTIGAGDIGIFANDLKRDME